MGISQCTEKKVAHTHKADLGNLYSLSNWKTWGGGGEPILQLDLLPTPESWQTCTHHTAVSVIHISLQSIRIVLHVDPKSCNACSLSNAVYHNLILANTPNAQRISHRTKKRPAACEKTVKQNVTHTHIPENARQIDATCHTRFEPS